MQVRRLTVPQPKNMETGRLVSMLKLHFEVLVMNIAGFIPVILEAFRRNTSSTNQTAFTWKYNIRSEVSMFYQTTDFTETN